MGTPEVQETLCLPLSSDHSHAQNAALSPTRAPSRNGPAGNGHHLAPLSKARSSAAPMYPYPPNSPIHGSKNKNLQPTRMVHIKETNLAGAKKGNVQPGGAVPLMTPIWDPGCPEDQSGRGVTSVLLLLWCKQCVGHAP